jgi:hypothetical protein
VAANIAGISAEEPIGSWIDLAQGLAQALMS